MGKSKAIVENLDFFNHWIEMDLGLHCADGQTKQQEHFPAGTRKDSSAFQVTVSLHFIQTTWVIGIVSISGHKPPIRKGGLWISYKMGMWI